MVLIDCPTCRRRLAVIDKNCPGCGRALERKRGWTPTPVIIDVLGFLGVVSMVGWLLWWLISGPSF